MLLAPLAVHQAAAAVVFDEDFDDGLLGWTVSGSSASSDCTTARSGCSLGLEPTSSTYVTANRDVAVDASAGATASFAFHASSTGGDSDFYFSAFLDDGTQVLVVLTDGSGSTNNYIGLHAIGVDGQSRAGQWPSANAWYVVDVIVDAASDAVRLRAWDADGNSVAESRDVLIPATASAITRLEFAANRWGGSHLTFHFDDVEVHAPAKPPSPPLSLAATATDVGEITVTWEPPADDGGSAVTGYRVYLAAAESGPWVLIGSTSGLAYVDSGLPNNVTRHYRATAVNAVGEGDASVSDDATTFDYPGAPMTFKATPGTQVGEIRLTWKPPAYDGGTPITHYSVFRHDGDGAWLLVAETGGTSFIDRLRLPVVAYHYRVTATNLVGEGIPSGNACGVAFPWTHLVTALLDRHVGSCATTVPGGIPFLR